MPARSKWDLRPFWVCCRARGPYRSIDMTRRPARSLPVLLAALALPGLALAARAYVSNEDDGTVSVIDTEQLRSIATVSVGKRPRGMVLSADGARLYIALTGTPKCPPPLTDQQCAKL